MKKFTLVDVQGSQRFQPLTQGEQVVIDTLLDKCNSVQSKIEGFIETRREQLHNSFDRKTVKDIIDILPIYDSENELLNSMTLVMIEQVTRDIVRPYMVEDIMKRLKQRLEFFNGDIVKTIDSFEAYYKSGKIVPFAQTWKEACEELEEGTVYYEPNSKRAL